MTDAVIVSQVSQLDFLLAARPMIYFCVNEDIHRECVKRRLECELLDEQMLAKEYIAINDWAYQTTRTLLERFKDQPKKYDRLNAAFIDVKAAFVEALKIIKVFRILEKTHPFDKLYLPTSDRDSFLAVVLKSLLKEDGTCLAFYEDKKSISHSKLGLKSALYAFLLAHVRKVASKQLARWERDKRRFIFASGSLVHLAPIVVQLRREGHGVLYCESDFNLEKFIFCLKQGLFFEVIPKGDPKKHPFSEMDIFFNPGEALYGSEDFSDKLQFIFRAALENGQLRNLYDENSTKRIFSSPSIEAVLLDEDFSSRRFFYVQAQRHSRPCFVVSHGVPALFLGNRSDLKGKYDTSVTFMQSDFEKSAYESIYCDSAQLRVTGLPRYDRLVGLAKKRKPSRSRQKSILYCGSIFYRYDFRSFFTVMGCKEFLGDFTKRYLLDLLDFCSAHPEIMLDIKPHFNEEKDWMRVIRAHDSKARWRLHSHRHDVVHLIQQADVLVTPESSVISEGIMLNKPVIVFNYGTQPLSTAHFEQRGVIWQARDKKGLHEGLQKCLNDENYLEVLEKNRKKSFSFFAGAFDGSNTQRVTQAILAEPVCAICGSSQTKFIGMNEDRNHFMKGEFHHYRCQDCEVIFIYPALDEKIVSTYYPQDYYSYNSPSVAGPPRKQGAFFYLSHPFRAANALFYSKVIGQNKDVRVRAGLRVLDVGCGDGSYLIKKMVLGCKCYGVDISQEALQKLKQSHPDIRTLAGNLWDAAWPDEFFDIVNVSHVLEHLTDPFRLLKEIRRVLKPNGCVRIHVPNGDSWTRFVFSKYWQGYEAPRHLWVFSPKNLNHLFQSAGLKTKSSRTMENSFSVLSSSIHVHNAWTHNQKDLMALRSVWDSEILKLLIVPYALIVNAVGKGDVIEYILTKG